MHVALCNFASAIDQRFPDLRVLRGADEDLSLEWKEAPSSPCYTITVYVQDGHVCAEYVGGEVSLEGDPLGSVVAAMSRERGLSEHANTPILAAPGTFGALVLERHLLRLSARPQSPDRLN